MDLRLDKYQDIQDFRDQYMSVKRYVMNWNLVSEDAKVMQGHYCNRRCQGANRGAIGGCTELHQIRASRDNFPIQVRQAEVQKIHHRKRKQEPSEEKPFPKDCRRQVQSTRGMEKRQ